MTPTHKNRRLARRLTLLAVLLSVQPAWAQPSAVVPIDIPSQSLAAALARFAEQTSLQMRYAPELLAGKAAPSVRGQLSPAAALGQLLAGSGLSFHILADGAVMVEAVAVGEGTPTRLRAVTVNAEGLSGASDRYATPVASTGTKTDTPLMETPVNVQVVPQKVLVDQKTNFLEDALKNVSGVYARNSGINETITLRGFAGTASMLHDGFRVDSYASPGMTTMTNVESVEVLKGPASILYGRLEPGGMVNVVTKQPQATPYYGLEQQVGSWDHYLTSFDATGAVNEDKSVLYRFIASYETNESYRDDVWNRKVFIAPSVKWILSPQTEVTVEGTYTHNPLITEETLQLPYDTDAKRFVWLPKHVNLTPSEPIDINKSYVALKWAHKFNDDWSIKHQVLYDDHRIQTRGAGLMVLNEFTHSGSTWTADRLLVPLGGSNKTSATILDLTGHFDTGPLKHTLLVGGDFYRLETPFWSSSSNVGSVIDVFTKKVSGPPLVVDPANYGASTTTTNSTGLYVQDQIKLPGHVHVLGGLRYQRVKVVGESHADSDVTPRLGVVWQPLDGLSLYANYTENFGANPGVTDFQGHSLKPEGAEQKEVGVKSELFGGKLQATVALFDITKVNVASADVGHPAPECGAGGCSVSLGKISSQGVELDIQGEITKNWNVIVTYAYTDARVDKSAPGSRYTQGNRLANVPRHMASLWSTYAFRDTLGHGWTFGGGVTHRSSATDEANMVDTPGYAVFDAMAAYEFTINGKKATAQVNVQNLFDKDYYMDALAYGTSGYLVWGRPRSVTASMKVEF